MLSRSVRALLSIVALWLIGATATSWWPIVAASPIEAIMLAATVCSLWVFFRWYVAWSSSLQARSASAELRGRGFAALARPLASEEIRIYARHEAMHAVVARSLGAEVTELVVGRAGGHTSYKPLNHLELAARHWTSGVISLASAGNNTGASQTDDANALSHIIQVLGIRDRPSGYDGPWDMPSLLAEAMRTAKRIASEQADTVDRVAAELARKRRLTGSEFEALASAQD